MPGKMRECDGCHKIMRSDNLKNHMRKCKELNQNLNVWNENIRYPFADNSSKMSKSINPNQQQSIHNQQHNKILNPKIP